MFRALDSPGAVRAGARASGECGDENWPRQVPSPGLARGPSLDKREYLLKELDRKGIAVRFTERTLAAAEAVAPLELPRQRRAGVNVGPRNADWSVAVRAGTFAGCCGCQPTR